MERFRIPEPMPWADLVPDMVRAEDALARLDERLAYSPIRDGWIARANFIDAAASVRLVGGLVHLEDLVLHDAGMDARAPAHEVTRAHAVLRTRRRIALAEPVWALSPAGLANLCGGAGEGYLDVDAAPLPEEDAMEDAGDGPDDLDAAFAALDQAMSRSDHLLSRRYGAKSAHSDRNDLEIVQLSDGDERPQLAPLLYDSDWNGAERLAAWRDILAATEVLPPVLACALAAEAWEAIRPVQHKPWLGGLLAAALLRERGKARVHLPCLHVGLASLPGERRRARSQSLRMAAWLQAVTAMAEAGLRDHERWMTARMLLARKLDGRRTTSRLPALLDLAMRRPVLSAGMIAAELNITPRAAQGLVAELGLRETTGRGRYRAWAII